MAYTVTKKQCVFGNERAVIINITADAATQTIETGLKVIDGFSVGYKSCSSNGLHIYANSNASGVQSYGVLGVSGFASGDQFDIVCYGR